MRSIKSVLAMGSAISLAMSHSLLHRPVRVTPRKRQLYVVPEKYQAQVHYTHRDPLQAALKKMNNWQHNQARRACKGNFRRLTPELLEHFTTLKKA